MAWRLDVLKLATMFVFIRACTCLGEVSIATMDFTG